MSVKEFHELLNAEGLVILILKHGYCTHDIGGVVVVELNDDFLASRTFHGCDSVSVLPVCYALVNERVDEYTFEAGNFRTVDAEIFAPGSIACPVVAIEHDIGE